MANPPVAAWRDRVARVLLVLGAVAALAGGVSMIPDYTALPGAEVERVWRSFGLVVFAGLFLLLAWRPRGLPGVWELVIFHKAALTVAGMFWLSGEVDGAGELVVSDGVLTAVLVGCYLLTEGWTAWRPSPPAEV